MVDSSLMAKEKVTLPKAYSRLGAALLGLGLVALLFGVIVLVGGQEHDRTRFWAVLLHNSVFFLMVGNGAMFLITAVSLAWGGWVSVFRRVPEALSAVVPVLSVCVAIILVCIVWGNQTHIYHWLDEEHVARDKILSWKRAFLNPTFYLSWSILTLVLWSVLGVKMRALSRGYVQKTILGVEAARKHLFKTTVWAGVYMFVFVLTMGSSIPWFWLLSIDAHWYSSIYSWYVFASVICATLAAIVLYVAYLKTQGYLEFVTREHLHDLGKLLFGFSTFWAYLWYSQYMLVWYANLPEETFYFKIRQQGPYAWAFYGNVVVNFALPFLLLMASTAKRSLSALCVTAIVVILGHWLDFYLLIMPGAIGVHYALGWFEWGIFSLFVGAVMYLVAANLTRRSLVPWSDPYFKESVVHSS